MNLKEILEARDLSYYADHIRSIVTREDDLDSAILIQKKRNDSLYEFYKNFYDNPKGDLLSIIDLDKNYYDKVKQLRPNEKPLKFEKVYQNMFGCSYMDGLYMIVQDFKKPDLNIVLPREDTDMLSDEEKRRYYAALILENEHFRERVEAINGTTLAFLLGDYIVLSGDSKTQVLEMLKTYEIRDGIFQNIETQLNEFFKGEK